jgi:hypothetical protein
LNPQATTDIRGAIHESKWLGTLGQRMHRHSDPGMTDDMAVPFDNLHFALTKETPAFSSYTEDANGGTVIFMRARCFVQGGHGLSANGVPF